MYRFGRILGNETVGSLPNAPNWFSKPWVGDGRGGLI